MRDAMHWLREPDYEHRQCLNARGRRFTSWRNLVMFVIPPRECDLFYKAVEPVWIASKRSCASGIPSLVVFSYMTERAQSESRLERDLV